MADDRFTLLGDRPHSAAADPLGFAGVADDLADLIVRSRDSTPFTLGIEAPWGMGKSSLMGALQHRLRVHDGIEVASFNAWTADESDVLEGVVKTVLDQLDPNVLRKALRNEKLVSWLRAAGLVVAGWLRLGSVVDLAWDRVAIDPNARNRLYDLVAEGVETWSSANRGVPHGRTLCVFIDDLDRCSADAALAVFEAMKLYLDVPGLVFVVGYDHTVVSDLVLRGKGYSEAVTARDFIEKFIQISYRLGHARRDQAQALVKTLLDESGTTRLFGDAELSLLVERNDRNPRRIKRFVNSFVLSYGLDPAWGEFDPETLVRVHLVVMHFESFARLIERPGDGDPIADFRAYRDARRALRERGPSWQAEVADAADRLRVVLPTGESDWGAVTRALEDQSPVEFAPLLDDEAFVSLIEALANAPRWSEIRRRLQRGELAFRSAPSTEAVETVLPRLDGTRIMWIDDEHERNNGGAIDLLRALGASVDLAASTESARRLLAAGSHDVLLSDIARDGDEEAGFDGVRQLRAEGVVPRRVIFYAGRRSSARERAVRALRAELTTGTTELVLAIAAEETRRPAPATRRVAQRWKPTVAVIGARSEDADWLSAQLMEGGEHDVSRSPGLPIDLDELQAILLLPSSGVGAAREAIVDIARGAAVPVAFVARRDGSGDLAEHARRLGVPLFDPFNDTEDRRRLLAFVDRGRPSATPSSSAGS